MTPEAFLAELERLNSILDDPNADNTAGRVDAIQYDVLPNLLRSERHLILKAVRAHVKPSHFQPEIFTYTRHEEENRRATLDGIYSQKRKAGSGEAGTGEGIHPLLEV